MLQGAERRPRMRGRAERGVSLSADAHPHRFPMLAPEILVHLAKPWADVYSNSKSLETIVTFVHVGALVAGGGVAIATDRATLRALRADAPARGYHLEELSVVHRWVITGLVLATLSGILLFAADVDTFWRSWIFWGKMALIVALLLNGLVMTRAETALRDAASPDDESHWSRLRGTAVTSLLLWLIITLAGVALVNVS